MPIKIVDKKRFYLFISLVLSLVVFLTFGLFWYWENSKLKPLNAQAITNQFLAKLQSSPESYIQKEPLTTKELKLLKEKQPELFSSSSQKRSEAIAKEHQELLNLTNKNKLGLIQDRNQLKELSFLKKLSLNPYTSKPSENYQNLLNTLKAQDSLKTYTYNDETKEILPVLKVKDRKLQTQETPYVLNLPNPQTPDLLFNQKSNPTAKALTLNLKESSFSNLQVYDNQALYQEVKGGIDQLLTSTPQGLTNAFILKTPQSLKLTETEGTLTLTYALNTSTLEAKVESGAIIFYDEAGTKQYVLTPPSIKDLNNQTTAQAKFSLEANTENTDPIKTETIPLTLIPKAQAQTLKPNYTLKVEVSMKPNAAFPLLLSYDFLPVLSQAFKEEEIVSQKQKAFLKELNLKPNAQDSDYLLGQFSSRLPKEAQELLKLEGEPAKIQTQTSSESFLSKVDLPQDEEKEETPPDPGSLNPEEKNQLQVRTSFDNLDDQISQTLSLKKGSSISSFKVKLKNSQNLSQAVYQGEKGDTKVYFGENEIITYNQNTQTQNPQIQLKENIYAKAPNDQNSSTYTFEFTPANGNTSLSLKPKEDGSVEVIENLQISGVDPQDKNEQQRIKNLVTDTLKISLKGSETLALIKPLTYVLKDGTTKTLPYEVTDNTLTIRIQEEAQNYPLLIDPTFEWGAWLGGTTTANDYIYALALGNDEEIYAGGYTEGNALDFIQTPTYTNGAHSGGYEGFVVELIDNASAAPTFNWLQWLGGTGYDYVKALAVSGDEIYAGGYANSNASWEVPIYTGGSYAGSNEGFVVELYDNLSAAPTLNWLQWLGGTGSNNVSALAINGDEIYAGGYASSDTDWETPTYTGGTKSDFDEGFVVELIDNPSAAPTFNWLQWLGGSDVDYVSALFINGDEIYAGGATFSATSWETPTYTGGTFEGTYAYEGFVLELADNASAAPTLNWLQWLGGTSDDYVYALAISDDEIYAGGNSDSSTSWENPTYTGGSHSGSDEGFVVELADNPSAAPTLNWLQWLGGTNFDYVLALAVSGDEIYAGGSATSTFAGETITYTGGTCSGWEEGFVAELTDNASAAPTFNWLQWLGGTGYDYVSALAVTGDEIYAGGYASSDTNWETPTYAGGTYSGGYEGFVAELADNPSAAPTFNWLQWLGGTSYSYEEIYALTVNNNHELYIGGYTNANLSFAPTPTYTGGTYSGGYEGFVAELADNPSAAPTFNWLQWLGGTGVDKVQSIAIDGDEIYAGGYANSAASWEVPTYTGGSYSGSNEGFVAELYDNASAAPTFNWLQWLGGSNADYINSLAVNGDEIYAGGYADSATSWEAPTYPGGTFSGNYEGFVAELTDNASAAPNFNWLQWLGGTGYDRVYALATNGDEIYAGGYAGSTFAGETITYTGGSHSGSDEGFVVELADNPSAAPTLNWLQWLGGTNFDYVLALAVSGDEIYAGGYATSTFAGETITYTGGTHSGSNEGFVAELADNAGAAPTFNWLQWLGGAGFDYVHALAVTGDEVYAGGDSSSDTSWETPACAGGIHNGNTEGFVVELADNASAAPTFNWLQWLGGGTGYGYGYVYALAVTGDEIYAGGYADSATSFETPFYTLGSYSGSGEALITKIYDTIGDVFFQGQNFIQGNVRIE